MDAGTLSLPGPLQPVVMCHSELVLADIQGTVKHAQDIDVAIVPHEIGGSVVPMQQHPNVAR